MMCVGISSFRWYTRQTMIDEFSCGLVLGCCDGGLLDAEKDNAIQWRFFGVRWLGIPNHALKVQWTHVQMLLRRVCERETVPWPRLSAFIERQTNEKRVRKHPQQSPAHSSLFLHPSPAACVFVFASLSFSYYFSRASIHPAFVAPPIPPYFFQLVVQSSFSSLFCLHFLRQLLSLHLRSSADPPHLSCNMTNTSSADAASPTATRTTSTDSRKLHKSFSAPAMIPPPLTAAELAASREQKEIRRRQAAPSKNPVASRHLNEFCPTPTPEKIPTTPTGKPTKTPPKDHKLKEPLSIKPMRLEDFFFDGLDLYIKHLRHPSQIPGDDMFSRIYAMGVLPVLIVALTIIQWGIGVLVILVNYTKLGTRLYAKFFKDQISLFDDTGL